MRKILKKCEFCEKPMRAPDGTVCGACDRRLEKEQSLYFKQLYGKHRRQCRECGDELPPTRYFRCLICEPMLDGEDPYLEMTDDVSIEGRESMHEHVRVPGLDRKLNSGCAKRMPR